MNTEPLPHEHSFYRAHRALRARGFVSGTSIDGRIMLAMDEPLPDESLFTEQIGDRLHDFGFNGDGVNLTAQNRLA
jgi:hypothetical protein